MIYQEIIPIAKRQAELHLADTDISLICETLVRLAYHEPDWQWVQEQCLRFCKHDNIEVKRLAIICLGHLARIHGTLNMDLINPILTELLKDKDVSGTVENTLDDIKIFINPEE